MKMLARLAVLLAFLLVSTIACGDSSSSSSSGEAPPTSSANPNDNAAAAGSSSSSGSSGDGDGNGNAKRAPVTCSPGTKTGKAGDEDVAMKSGGIDREAIVHVPATHDGVRALPIVLVLHPLLLTYKDMRKIAKVDEKYADDPEHGFIAVYPNGISRSWNAGECCGKAKDQQVDDVGFIHELLTLIDAKWCVDKSRLYSMGFSNGAFLSHRLACQLENDFTLRAIVPVAGTLGIPEADCKPANKTAVLAIHGTEDSLVPYAGGPPDIPRGESFGTFVSPPITDAYWAKMNGCNAEAGAAYYAKGEVSCVRHESCANDASVGLCTVTNGGHQWPSGPSLPAMGHLTTDIDASAAAIEFFRAHGL